MVCAYILYPCVDGVYLQSLYVWMGFTYNYFMHRYVCISPHEDDLLLTIRDNLGVHRCHTFQGVEMSSLVNNKESSVPKVSVYAHGLRGQDCRGQDCRGLDCRGQDCRGLDCRGLDCRGQDYRGQDCRGQDCRGQHCRGQDCRGQDCRGLDCRGLD